jgi:putative ABC transport system permease protein
VPFEYGSWSNTIAQSDIEGNFFDFFNMPLVSGETFKISRKYGHNDVIINETLQNLFNNNSDEVKWIQKTKLNIIGVVKDYHIQSLKNPIKPLVIRNNFDDRFQLFIKYQPPKAAEAVELTNSVLAKFSSGNRNDLFFLDEMIMRTYDKEKQQLYIYIIFSIITIFISCLGLVGLTIYSVERREKEIAIRKANGAKTGEIVNLFVGGVCKWIFASFLIAIVPSYLIMQKWLQNFSYRTEISWLIFASSLIITLAIAVTLIFWLTWRSASKNPVEALRFE